MDVTQEAYARLIGILYTDGCLSPKGNGWRIIVSNNSPAIVDSFAEASQLCFKKPVRRSVRGKLHLAVVAPRKSDNSWWSGMEPSERKVARSIKGALIFGVGESHVHFVSLCYSLRRSIHQRAYRHLEAKLRYRLSSRPRLAAMVGSTSTLLDEGNRDG